MKRFQSKDGASVSSPHMSQENVNSSTMKSNLRRRPLNTVSGKRAEVPVESLQSKNAPVDAAEKVFLKHLNLVPIKKSGTDVIENRNSVHINSRRKLCDKSNRNLENNELVLRRNVGPDFNVKDGSKWVHSDSSNGRLKVLQKQGSNKGQWIQDLKSLKQKRTIKSNVMQSMSNQQLNHSTNFLWPSKASQVTLGALHNESGLLCDWKHQVLVKRQADIRHEAQKFVDKYATKIEICSPLGQRLLEKASHCRSQESKEEYIRHYELSCTTNYKQLPYKLPGFSSISCVPISGSSRTLRSNNIFNGDSCSWSPQCSTHSYTFSKTERLNKWAFLETGLNWKGRILSWFCSPVTVNLIKMDVCPFCREKYFPGNVHSCNGNDAEDDTDSEDSENSANIDNDSNETMESHSSELLLT